MKTIIFWFSGTGNSLAVAKDLAAKLGDTELVPITKVIHSVPPTADRIGIVFPVYAFGMPRIVSKFVKNMPVNSKAYYFTVATMGGTPGAPHRCVDTILKSHDARLSAGWSIRMPSNYPILSGPPSQEQQQRLFADAEKQIADIAEIVKRGEISPLQDSFLLLRGLARLMNPMAVSFFAKADKNFVVKDNCTKCDVCEKVCPVQNITLIDGKPFWLHHCEQCMACLQWCPVEAIQAGRITEGRKRYQHPRFKAQDFFLEK